MPLLNRPEEQTALEATLAALRRTGAWRDNPRADTFAPLIEQTANATGVPVDLLGSLIERESQFDPKAESGAGAVGLAQLMPVHHKAVNPRDPIDSVRYSADYLTKLRGRFGGWDKTLAAYNYGPANVAKAVQTRGSEWKGALPAETAAYIAALTKGLK